MHPSGIQVTDIRMSSGYLNPTADKSLAGLAPMCIGIQDRTIYGKFPGSPVVLVNIPTAHSSSRFIIEFLPGISISGRSHIAASGLLAGFAFHRHFHPAVMVNKCLSYSL